MDNVVINLCAKFDDDRLRNEKALLLLITTTRTTLVALGDQFTGPKIDKRIVGENICSLQGLFTLLPTLPSAEIPTPEGSDRAFLAASDAGDDEKSHFAGQTSFLHAHNPHTQAAGVT